MIEGPSELLWQTRSVESLNIDQTGTLRLISGLYFNLDFRSEEDFIAYITGKDVLDLGSGLNGLAIDCILRELPVNIISVNPAISHPHFSQRQCKEILEQRDKFAKYGQDKVDKARQIANQNTYPFFAHQLNLPDSSVDLIIDHAATFYYMDPEHPLALVRSIEEMVRVCKAGGRIRVVDFGIYYGRKEANWKEKILQDLELQYTPYTQNTPKAIGLEIQL